VAENTSQIIIQENISEDEEIEDEFDLDAKS
jgi:hypothetical protein